jgi:hypothetical protein
VKERLKSGEIIRIALVVVVVLFKGACEPVHGTR